jgi:Oxidoreductase family, NAD-binding Rossmann fold
MHISRRKIIKALGIVSGVAASGLLPAASAIQDKPFAAIDHKRVFGKYGLDAVLIGAGKRGMEFGAYAMRHQEHLRITGIAEPLADRLQKAESDFGVKSTHCFTDWNAVFSMPKFADVAIICSTSNYFAACSAALRAGYDIWVDRPVSLDKQETVAINTLARQCGRNIYFCYIYPDQLNFMDHRKFKMPVKTALTIG